MEPEYDTKDARAITPAGCTYLSFDIGIRNFAYCLVNLEGQTVRVLEWENIDILVENGNTKMANKVTMAKIRPLLVQTLEKRRQSWLRCDYVLIEQQIGHSRNAKMEGMVCMWLHLRLGKPIQSVSPKQKLTVNYQNGLWSKVTSVDAQVYKKRKEYTINLLKTWIMAQCPTIQAIFQNAAKQDDLADVLVQAIAIHIKQVKK